MASAFALTLAYLGEQCSSMDAGGAFAAYITGNVASNLIGRLVSAAVVDNLGLASNFYFFAPLNLAGAVLVYFTIQRVQRPCMRCQLTQSPLAAMIAHWRNPALRSAFGIGFCILFAFIGTFTYVNFVLVRPPLSLGRMDLGFVYFVFLPSIVTTLLAGKAVGAVRNAAGDLGRARGRRHRPAADAVLASCRSPGRHGSGRRRHVLRAGLGDRLCRTGGRRKSRAWRAAPISPAISLAASSAAPCSASCSIASDGPPALPASAHHLPWPQGLRSTFERKSAVGRHLRQFRHVRPTSAKR